MSNVIELLERLGQDSQLRHATDSPLDPKLCLRFLLC